MVLKIERRSPDDAARTSTAVRTIFSTGIAMRATAEGIAGKVSASTPSSLRSRVSGDVRRIVVRRTAFMTLALAARPCCSTSKKNSGRYSFFIAPTSPASTALFSAAIVDSFADTFFTTAATRAEVLGTVRIMFLTRCCANLRAYGASTSNVLFHSRRRTISRALVAAFSFDMDGMGSENN